MELMTERDLFDLLLISWFAMAGIVFFALFFVTAPYGRHTREGWGPRVNRRLGWVLMELPSAALFALWFVLGEWRTGVLPLVFLALWQFHYINRSLIFPFRMRGGSSHMTLLTVLLAIVFNSGNTYINARWLYTLGPGYPESWLMDPRFIAGVCLFVVGLFMNWHSDRVLRKLRAPGESGYKIPQGGMYRLVSCPNYLGEIIEWTGWALATWSLAGLSFAVWTFANLAPRAWAHHKWYRRQFPDYPADRKALLPFLL
jgi:protein-S-isoprenylcysteine O-methyltransferase Ste14